MLVQEVWQKKEVDIVGDLEEEAVVQKCSLGLSTCNPDFR